MAILVDGQRGVLEHHLADRLDVQMANALAGTMDVLLAPPGLEVGGNLLQVLHQRGDIRVLGRPHEVATKAREDLQRLFFPGVEQLVHGRAGEQHPQQVAPIRRQRGEAEDPIRRGIPGQHVPAQVEHVGRARRDVAHQPVDQRRHHAPGQARFWRQALMSQQEQVAPLGGIQLERSREVVEEGGGHADVPPLLQPGVPGQSHPSQGSDLLAAQSWRPPPAAGGQPHLLRRNPLTPAAQEFGQLCPGAFECARRAHPVTSSNSINGQIVTLINSNKNTSSLAVKERARALA
ncbi:hypothetical protein D3C84_711690 [compost metagenome]